MGKMKALAMDMEDNFIDEVSARIGGCEDIQQLIDDLFESGCFKLISHMNIWEQKEFLDELWGEFWSNHQ